MFKPHEAVLSHWSILIENLEASPLTFYQSVGEALSKRQVPQTANSRVQHREAGLLSAEREYMRVKRETVLFDVCGAPFGTGFFVSWWFVEEVPRLNPMLRVLVLLVMLAVVGYLLTAFGFIVGLFITLVVVGGGLSAVHILSSEGHLDDTVVRALPLLGALYVWLFRPATYYRIDSMEMFQKAVHNSVLEVIDGMTTAKGIRALSEADRKPILTEFYNRKLKS